MRNKVFKQAFLDTLPVLSGYIVLGIGFGIMLEEAGYGVFWSFLMGAFIYAGSMQYVGVSLLTNVATLPAIAFATLMVNARHLFYGVSMIDKYKGLGLKKPYMIFALTDETYSLVCYTKYDNKKERDRYCFLVSFLNQSYWVTGCVVGSLVGAAIPFSMEGIEFSMTALFITVVVEQWISAKNHIPSLIGFGASIACLLIFGSESFLIPSMIIITIGLSLMKGRRGKDA